MFKEPKLPMSPMAPDYDDEEVVTRMLEDGGAEEMEDLRKHIESKQGRPIAVELIERFRRFARLRRDAYRASDADASVRSRENPRATDEELGLGAYIETLEPQVRDAVLALRRKGYPTYESGFSGLDSQNVRFEQAVPELQFFEAQKDLADLFSDRKITLGIEPKRVWFSFSEPLSLEEMKFLWDRLAAALPDLKRQAPPMSLPVAEGFRKKQARLKQG